MSISNTNNHSTIVLNDCTLLELILQHPFIYDSNLIGSRDADYLQWAWKNICTAYCNTYAVLPEQLRNLTEEAVNNCLQNRWLVVRSIVQHIRELYSLETLPIIFKHLMKRLDARFEKNTPNNHTELNDLQKVLMNSIPFVRQLSHHQKMLLEQKFLHRLLKLEMDTKINENPMVPNEANITKETNQFFDAIGFDKMYEYLEKERETNGVVRNINNHRNNITNDDNSNDDTTVQNINPKRSFTAINFCKITIEEDKGEESSIEDNQSDEKSTYDSSVEKDSNNQSNNIEENNQVNNLDDQRKLDQGNKSQMDNSEISKERKGFHKNKVFQSKLRKKSARGNGSNFSRLRGLKSCKVLVKRLKSKHYITSV